MTEPEAFELMQWLRALIKVETHAVDADFIERTQKRVVAALMKLQLEKPNESPS